jgi:hypothetical protein
MKTFEAELLKLHNQLKTLSDFSEHNLTALNGIVEIYRKIIEEQYHDNPAAYALSKNCLASVEEKFQLFKRNDILTKKNAFSIIRRTLLRSIARDLQNNRNQGSVY